MSHLCYCLAALAATVSVSTYRKAQFSALPSLVSKPAAVSRKCALLVIFFAGIIHFSAMILRFGMDLPAAKHKSIPNSFGLD